MQAHIIKEADEWDALLAQSSEAHPLQTWGWGEVKRASGWGVFRTAVTDDSGHLRAAGQVLTRLVPRTPLSMIYMPRGPVVQPLDGEALMALMQAIEQYRHKVGAIFCKIDPAWPTGTNHALATGGFVPSQDPVQVTETYTIDLTHTEEEILGEMRSKTRQYIRKAEREETTIIRATSGEWLEACYQIYKETSTRAHFGLHPRSYYDHIFRLYDANHQYLYVALRDGQPLSFLWLACFGRSAVELYGGVADAGQDYKSNYLLKWHAIQQMKAAGYQLYDLNGRVNEGISQFKQGFGPAETTWIGPFDHIYHPLLYRAWTRALPLARRFLARGE